MTSQTEKKVASPQRRHEQILKLLMQRGSVSVITLGELLKVSEVTIRKDLNALERQGKLYRTHGSAISVSPYIRDRHINEKEKQNVTEKTAIGDRAAQMVEDNDSIIIASGTTMAFFARSLRDFSGSLTVITSAVQVTSILSQNRNIDVFQLGGFVRSSSVSVVGDYAEDILSNFHCTKLFLGIDGLTPDFGLTTTNMMEASLNQVMMGASQKVIVLADSTKFGRIGFSRICGLESIDEIITDEHMPPRIGKILAERGIEVTMVSI